MLNPPPAVLLKTTKETEVLVGAGVDDLRVPR